MESKEFTLLPEQRLKERHLPFGVTLPGRTLPEIVAELPEKVIVELETVNFYPFDTRRTNLVFRLRE